MKSDPYEQNLQQAIHEGFVKVVSDLASVLTEPFGERANVVLCRRHISGDFNALAKRYSARFLEKASETISPSLLSSLKVTPDEKLAARAILQDMAEIRRAGFDQELRLIQPQGYRKSIMVHRPHVDYGALSGRVLACYSGVGTEGYVPDDCTVNIRNILEQDQGVSIKPGARPFRFSLGDIWRQAVVGSPAVQPFVHYAPVDQKAGPRLLLVAG